MHPSMLSQMHPWHNLCSGCSKLWNSLNKAKEFLGRFKNSSMSQWAKWIAIESVMYPAIMYPHVNTYSTDQEIKPIDFIVSQLCCATLGLNRNFLIAILHGPTLLREGLASHPQNRKTQRIG
jgi:hypothetical protein